MQNYIGYFLTLSRRKKIVLQLSLDALLLAVSFVGAMLFKLESLNFAVQPAIWVVLLPSIIVTLLVFWGMGLYRAIVRFITGKLIVIVGKGVVAAAILLYILGDIFNADLPWSVPIVFAMFALLSIGGLRFTVKAFMRNPIHLNKQTMIIYGAGKAGLQLLNALYLGQEFAPVAMVDDDLTLQNLDVGGVRVYSPDKIPQLVRETGASVILLAIPSIGRTRRKEIVNRLQDLQLEIKTIPGLSDIISGKAKISDLIAVSTEDLLGRDPVAPDPELLGKNITGRVVMVSGAGGSIGSELCRQILTQKPSVLVLYEVSEFALYEIETELTAMATRLQYQIRVVPILGSVQDSQLLENSIKTFNVQTIYHAAAYKHVPLVEENLVAGVQNNVFGTLAITLAAQKCGVKNFILISTDKAVRPTNVMGATKRIAELICQAHAHEASSTVFTMVRFGNVLGSSGSVIPRFRTQIEAGGPITVTHRDINRYFMTVQEAAQLVVQAGALGQGGDVFVLDMGDPVKIMDLAFSMVKLYGLTPYLLDHTDQTLPDKGDIAVCVTGLRKGEKLFEELMIGNNPEPTKHARILTASEVSVPHHVLMPILDRLLRGCVTFDILEIVSIFHELPLEYVPQSTDISDLLWGFEYDAEEGVRGADEVDVCS
jgi:FlaA1/EpsC-like NDP-sugar epimerase